MQRVKAVAFDLDGTLIRTTVNFEKMKREIIQLFGEFGLDKSGFSTSELTYTIIERGLALLASRGVSHYRLKELEADITRIMNRVELESLSHVEAMSGVRSILLELKERGLRIGVITRGCRAYTLAALERTGISDLIDVVLARDDVKDPKPHPSHLRELMKSLGVSRDEIILVGDHLTDYECAKAVQVVFLGIPSGKSGLAHLAEADPRAVIIDSLNDLPALLERIPSGD